MCYCFMGDFTEHRAVSIVFHFIFKLNGFPFQNKSRKWLTELCSVKFYTKYNYIKKNTNRYGILAFSGLMNSDEMDYISISFSLNWNCGWFN